MEWLGRFHPLIVHLPIGILLLAILFEWLILFQPWKKLVHSIPMMLLLGSLGAWVACLTGYLLSQQDDYGDVVDWHQWLSIGVAGIGTIYGIGRERLSADMSKLISITLLLLITITGHLGGTLTHGDNYLFASAKTEKEIDLANAYYYEDVVKPILENKCVSCHGINKQKGKLRLDDPSFIKTGGKHGAVLVPNQADASEMIKRLLLPMDSEEHMPPSEKPQLKKEEFELLQDWIATGATFDKKFAETNSLRRGTQKKVEDKIPQAKVAPASYLVIQKLQQLGVTVTPLSSQTNFLQVALTNASISDSLFRSLLQIKEQIVWLKADNRAVGNEELKKVMTMPNVTKLWLTGSQVDNEGLLSFAPNKNLSYLNLTGLRVSISAIEGLLTRSNLNSLFLYQTNLTSNDIAQLQKRFKDTIIEGGGYVIPALATDTVEVKQAIRKSSEPSGK